MPKTFKVMVACRNAQGEPDFFFCIIKCSEEQFESGDHYEGAKAQAEEEGYVGEMVAFDEFDPAGMMLLPNFIWEAAVTYDMYN